MNTQIDTCMQQIAALTEIVTTLQDDCTELQQTNAQLLRQHTAINTELALAHSAIRKIHARYAITRQAADVETIQHLPFPQPTQRIPHRCHSLDGKMPLRKLRDELGAELEAKRN